MAAPRPRLVLFFSKGAGKKKEAGSPIVVSDDDKQRDDHAQNDLKGEVSYESAGAGDDDNKALQELIEVGKSDTNVAEGILAKRVHDKLKSVQEEPPASQGSESNEDPEAMMWNALVGSNFHFKTSGAAGNPIAGKWARYLKKHPEFKKEYEKSDTPDAKKLLRRQWCEGQYNQYKETKSHTISYSTKDESEGTMFGLHRIAVEEGGGEAGMKAALNYCLRCIKEGPGWVEYNEWTQTAKYRYVVQRKTETNAECWQKKSSWISDKKTKKTKATLLHTHQLRAPPLVQGPRLKIQRMNIQGDIRPLPGTLANRQTKQKTSCWL